MLSVKEAATKLGVAPVSVRMWARKGRLPGAELKESDLGVPYWLIPETALDTFDKSESKPGPKPGAKKGVKAS